MPVRNPSLVNVQDESVSQGQVTDFNFTGAGVTASVVGTVATINIAGGAGAGVTTVEVNLGSVNWRGKFTVVDATVSGTSKINIWQAPGPYTGKGTRADEAEMDYIKAIASPGTGQFDVFWRSVEGYATDYNDIRGLQPVGSANTQHGQPFYLALTHKVLGRVKGNIKFNYTVG
jgi:hypothetical protein